MNLRNSKWILRASSFVLTLILCFVFTFPVQADKKSDQLQGDLSNLNKELKTLEKELDEIEFSHSHKFSLSIVYCSVM